ncbi:hypothetical protein [Lewinella sp. IMCC34191]|uniref:hypothetical protein n=1 Tax=Lewinella sp. IMCC34191 TaxID=2259172 RepID=UPI000E25919E|nr:hypothetical protein [Lewinella sp. IMCC34191]
MTYSILSYEVFWDTETARGGVDLVLAEGQLVRLTTERPDMLTCWNTLLSGPCPHYYRETGSAGICTITYPRLRAVRVASRSRAGH